ncbi:MAG: glutamine synthetase beta-grasp domain-containing protein [Oscillospiraceae bacterium]|jgi:glutamine synthetase|nr:glutamine synthetase beta-grasp domain-containing protein [Oscillospiraceae bacterium]
MGNSVEEVLRFIRDGGSDVKFVRLAFCDADGTPKNISVAPDELERAFTRGVAFDPGAIPGFDGETQPLLFPDPGTLAVLPWRPQQGRVVRFYCELRDGAGNALAYDTRVQLRRAAEALTAAGITLQVGASCDFYLFRTDAEGAPTNLPFDNGGYFDVYPLDRGENVRREICSYLEVMSVVTTASYHAYGPGQNTIALRETDALTCADNLQTFKTVVGAVTGQNGLAASLAPRPLPGTPESKLGLLVSYGKRGEAKTEERLGASPSANPYAELARLAARILRG